MRHAQKNAATNEEPKPSLVPRLRFPEFEGAWEEKVLIDTCSMQAGKFVAASAIADTDTGNLFPCYGGNGLRGYTSTHTHDGVYPLIGRQGALCGNVRLASGRFHATEHAVVATPMSDIDVYWLYYLLDMLNLNRFATGQAQPGLSVDVLCKAQVFVPRDIPEQQRIASCLSSLDELIGAQARKVDALKTHKKGLMQQLFPREGETLPRLRFPEFEGAWETRIVKQFAKVTTGAKDTQNKVDGGRYPFFVRSQIVEQIDTYCLDGEAVLTSGDGVGVGKNFHHVIGKFDFHQRVYCIYDFAKDISGFFFYLYFSEHFGERVMRMSAKNSVDSVRMAMITEMPTMLPSLPEQQRIASCLSSLDELITKESHKLETYKTHKKGLMQQLFPSPEEVEA